MIGTGSWHDGLRQPSSLISLVATEPVERGAAVLGNSANQRDALAGVIDRAVTDH
jgi:hypothetical protein